MTYFITASSSIKKQYRGHPSLHDCPPNSHVFWYGPKQNSRRYGAHIYNLLHQRTFSKGSKYVTYHEGQWYSLQHTKGELFSYLGSTQPNLAQFDLNLTDDSNEYRETWEASRVPLIDSDQFKSEESTEDSEESDFEDEDVNRQIRQLTIHPPSYLMATTSTTTTQAATTMAQPPAQSTSTSTSTSTGTTPANVLRSLQQALRRHAGCNDPSRHPYFFLDKSSCRLP